MCKEGLLSLGSGPLLFSFWEKVVAVVNVMCECFKQMPTVLCLAENGLLVFLWRVRGDLAPCGPCTKNFKGFWVIH